jgi:hypothetical protein
MWPADERPVDTGFGDWPGQSMPAGRDRHSRTPLMVLLLVAAMALVGGAIAAVVAFSAARPSDGPIAGPTGGPSTGPSAPATTADRFPPPGDLRLRDDGDSLTLTWTDPGDGTVPFLIAGGRAGRPPQKIQAVESGSTSFTLNGITPTGDYCFLVVAVYSPEHTAPSTLVCTRRTAGPSGAPSR